jgi:primosomal protein N' (replication factor Y)
MGSGTQKIEEVIEKNYPQAKILRMDNDTTNIKNGHFKILEKFRNEDYNILLGTQMVAKGLDFHDVTLVGVINADNSLSAADFRSAEYTFELLSQVAGRAGRGEKKGNVIVQTYNPEHYTLQMASRHEYELFYQTDMIFRNKMKYPPFSYMSSITVLCVKADQACILADNIFEHLKNYKDFELLGPALPYLFKENEKIRVKILVKSKNHDLIRDVFNDINKKFAKEAKERKCSVVFDIDTYHLL